jgi:PAS domain S-box-containing protein
MSKQELPESDEFMVNALSDAVATLDYRGIVQYASPVWQSAYGFNSESMPGKHFSAFSDQHSQSLIHSYLEKIIEGNPDSSTLEHRITNSKNEHFWVETKAILDEKNRQVILVSRDIRKRRKGYEGLREMTELLHDTEKLAKVGGWKLDLNGNKPIWTKGCFDIHELESRVTYDVEWALSFYPPEDRRLIQDTLDKAVAQREKFDLTCQFITAKQNRKWVRVTGHPVEKDGEIVELIGLIMDVTEQKEAETALHRQTAMQQIIMDISSKYINIPLDQVQEAVKDSLGEIGNFVSADRAYVFEYDFQEKTASNTYEWCANGIEPQIEHLQNVPLSLMKSWVDRHRVGKIIHIEDVSGLDPGQVREMLEPQGIKSLITVPMMFQNGCVGFVGFDMVRRKHTFNKEEKKVLSLFAQMLVNVKDRHKAQQRLEESRTQLLKLTQNVPGIIFQYEMSPEGKFSFPFISKGINELSPGYTEADFKKDSETPFRYILKEEIPKLRAAILESAKEMSVFSAEYRVKLADGKIGWHLVKSVPERLKEGTVVWYGIAQDISREKEMEAIRNRAAELELKNKEMERFSSIASHDMREPLRTIHSYVSVLENKLEGQLDEPAQKYMSFIKDASTRMNQLITGLLEYSQLGKDMNCRAIDLKQMLSDIRQDLDSSIKEKNAELIIGDIPEKIYGYELEIRLLFQNLISNAIKYSRNEAPPIVHLKGITLSEGWEFQISDNGIGIAPQYKKKIFNIFERLHQSEYEGTGIGLANCKKVVEMHNGKIWLKSEVNQGTTFFFVLKNMSSPPSTAHHS